MATDTRPTVEALRRRLSLATSKTILRDVSALQLLVSASLLVPFLVSVLFREWYNALAFLSAAVVTAAVSGAAYRMCEDAPEPERHHAMVIAAVGWLTTALFGALPFVIAAYVTPAGVLESYVPAGAGYQSSLLYFRDPLHAFFESMSGYTTTGLTMSVHEPSVGRGFLWYRSQMQWLGGAGMIVLSLAVLRQSRGLRGSRCTARRPAARSCDRASRAPPARYGRYTSASRPWWRRISRSSPS